MDAQEHALHIVLLAVQTNVLVRVLDIVILRVLLSAVHVVIRVGMIVLVVVDPLAQVELELTVLLVEPHAREVVVVQDVHRLVEVMDAIPDVAHRVHLVVVLSVQ